MLSFKLEAIVLLVLPLLAVANPIVNLLLWSRICIMIDDDTF